MRSFRLEILSPDYPFFSGECVSLVFPTSDGMMGVQAGHAPLTASIRNGVLTFTTPGGAVRRCTVRRGMISVSGNRARVLCESAEELPTPDET